MGKMFESRKGGKGKDWDLKVLGRFPLLALEELFGVGESTQLEDLEVLGELRGHGRGLEAVPARAGRLFALK